MMKTHFTLVVSFICIFSQGEWTTTARKGKRKEVGKVGDTDQIIAQGDTKISGGKSSRGTGTRGGNNKSGEGTLGLMSSSDIRISREKIGISNIANSVISFLCFSPIFKIVYTCDIINTELIKRLM